MGGGKCHPGDTGIIGSDIRASSHGWVPGSDFFGLSFFVFFGLRVSFAISAEYVAKCYSALQVGWNSEGLGSN